MVTVLFAVAMLVGASSAPVEYQGKPALASVAQDPAVEAVVGSPFRKALLNAGSKAVKDGKMKRIDLIRLRVATLSPAFLEHAQDLAIVQMAFSGDDVPTNDDGVIDAGSIDWEGLALFLEKLIPLILRLIDALAFAGGEGVIYYA